MSRTSAGLFAGRGKHLVTVHGSALNFLVRISSFLRRYALEGIAALPLVLQ